MGRHRGARGRCRVPAGPGDHPGVGRLRFGAGTRTSWTFRSGAAADTTLLPLLHVDYAVPVDARNAVGSQRTHDLGLNVRMQDGMAAPRGVRRSVETYYDDGKTWATARTAPKGSGFTATVQRLAKVHGDAYVTLRVTAKDAAGNSVRQTIDRAYLRSGAR